MNPCSPPSCGNNLEWPNGSRRWVAAPSGVLMLRCSRGICNHSRPRTTGHLFLNAKKAFRERIIFPEGHCVASPPPKDRRTEFSRANPRLNSLHPIRSVADPRHLSFFTIAFTVPLIIDISRIQNSLLVILPSSNALGYFLIYISTDG